MITIRLQPKSRLDSAANFVNADKLSKFSERSPDSREVSKFSEIWISLYTVLGEGVILIFEKFSKLKSCVPGGRWEGLQTFSQTSA